VGQRPGQDDVRAERDVLAAAFMRRDDGGPQLRLGGHLRDRYGRQAREREEYENPGRARRHVSEERSQATPHHAGASVDE
jgi:hypothetical protein